MPGYQSPADDPTTGDTQSNITVSHNQSETHRIAQVQQQSGLDAGAQPGANQCCTEQLPPGHIHQLEMEVQRQRGVIEHILRWVWPPYAPGISAEAQFIRGDPRTQEIVPKGFVTQAYQNHAELYKTKQALKQKIEECDKIREHWQTVIGELSDLKSSKQIFMVDDAEMAAKWKQLQYSIKKLARTYLSSVLAPERLTRKHGALLESTSVLYQEFLGAEGRTHLLFQSFMWSYITDRILRNPTTIWGQQVSQAAKTLFKFYSSKSYTEAETVIICFANRDYRRCGR